MSATVAAGALLGTVTGAVLLRVGWVARRRAPPEERGDPLRLFALWWWGGALAVLVEASHGWLATVGVMDAGTHTVVLHLEAFPVCVGLWGLQCYLSYLWLGTRRLFAPLAAGYLGLLALNLYVYNVQAPWTPVEGGWGIQLLPARPQPGLVQVYGALFALPVLVATVLYASLWFRAPAGEPRYRVAMVSGAFALLFGALAAAFALGLQDASWFALTYELPALLASLLVLAAFTPPSAVRRRFAAAA